MHKSLVKFYDDYVKGTVPDEGGGTGGQTELAST